MDLETGGAEKPTLHECERTGARASAERGSCSNVLLSRAVSDLLLLSASALARKIAAREISSREVLEAHIARVQVVNPTINAVVADRFDAARREADECDRRLPSLDDRPPFFGVPCTIKESFALEGMPNSGGLVARKDHRPSEDATAVDRLRRAGAIPMGVTNVSELCMWMETNNRVYGRSNNPYDRRRIVGGSSGGEGAIVGAGASPFGLGADIGGSIRMPAFFNGVFGHKPSGGLVPGTGQFPIAKGAALRYLTSGPLCRRAEDLMPLLRILAGPDGRDEGCLRFQLGDPNRVDVKMLRVIDVHGNGVRRVHSSLKLAQRRVAEHLDQIGCEISTARFPLLRFSFDIWSSMLSVAEGRSRFRELMQRRSIGSLLWQLLLWMFGRSPHTIPAIMLGIFENVTHALPKRAQRFIERGLELKGQLIQALGDDAVMLYPSYPLPAPRHYFPLFPPFSWIYTAIINVMELPSTQVPLGLDDRGVPLGVQVVAGPGKDHLTIAVAMELERAFGGWVPPPDLITRD